MLSMFENKKVNLQKLVSYGFTRNNATYFYTTNIVNGQFQMIITITEDGTVNTKVLDSASNEYVLHRIPEACGPFVSKVRADYESVLYNIAEKCFELNIFKSNFAQKIIQHIQNTYHDDLEFLWPQFPNNAIFRRKDTNKWYAALLVLSKRKLGLNSDELIDILDLKADPEEITGMVDGKKCFPGYHMNKKHWYTLCLDGSVPFEEILRRLDTSYKLSAK
ncbi:MAG: MmcQ/YjbR family DNA-binding protein [Candidatus Bathyarchaeota archaeon]|nr:MmcQ/YjbR family DNA-binding protein [Candidatus Termiticorpusculum sp.]MCL2867861.1 MmcQ/YjbR family DNA-binding protein [Candidatus Termiticorpusculum sp.]